MSWREMVKDFLASEDVEEEEYVEEPELDVPDEVKAIVAGARGASLEAALSRLEVHGLSTVEASRVLYFLDEQGDVRLVDSEPPRSLSDFALSWYSSWAWVVVGFLVVASSAVFVLPQVEPWIYLRYIAGAVYVLYVPGAVFIELLYPKREELEDLERFALAVGLSLAIVPLVGLVLNYTPWGIRLKPLYAGLSLLTLGFTFIAVYRKYTYHMLALEAVE